MYNRLSEAKVPMEQNSKSVEAFDDRVYRWCTSPESVSSLLAADPTLAPGDAWKRLYGYNVKKTSNSKAVDHAGEGALSQADLSRAEQCGKWGPTQPSELFLRVRNPHVSEKNPAETAVANSLQIYHDALKTLEDDPGRAMVSPSLMGSCGVVPLTVISV